jgi:hypothetical protein
MADKSSFTLFNPTPRELMRDMSTDRPDTTESPYTVDAGHFQVELSFVDYTLDKRNGEGETTHALSVAPVLFKAGLLNNVDVQFGLEPYTLVRVKDRAADDSDSFSGFGDTLIRLKVNLLGNDSGDVAFALMPYVKLPTASDELGNDDVEYGLIAPLALALPGEFSLSLMGELDIVRDPDDERYTLDLVHTVSIGHALIGELNGYIEYAGFANLNGADDYRGYLDAGVTYALNQDVQLDAGVRLGLTRAADDLGVFAGVSFRF